MRLTWQYALGWVNGFLMATIVMIVAMAECA